MFQKQEENDRNTARLFANLVDWVQEFFQCNVILRQSKNIQRPFVIKFPLNYLNLKLLTVARPTPKVALGHIFLVCLRSQQLHLVSRGMGLYVSM